MQRMLLRAKNTKNVVKPINFLKCSFYFETEGVHVQVTLLLCCHAFVWAPIEYARTKHIKTMWIGGSGSFVKHQQHTLILCRHHNNFPWFCVFCTFLYIFPHTSSWYNEANKEKGSWPSKNSHLLGWGGGGPTRACKYGPL